MFGTGGPEIYYFKIENGFMVNGQVSEHNRRAIKYAKIRFYNFGFDLFRLY